MYRSLLLALLTALTISAVSAEDKKEEKPKPDLWAAEIVVADGFGTTGDNQVKVIVENLAKDSEFEGNIPVELVVIDKESGERASYSAEVESMRYNQKREALFSGVKAPTGKTVRFLAIIDPGKALEESNEDNNRKLFQITVSAPKPAPAPEASEVEETPAPEQE